MTRALIVTWDGGGNLPPMLGIARALADRGDRVRVLRHEVQRTAIEAAGLAFTPIRRGRDYVSAKPRGTIDGVLGLAALFADRGIGADAIAMLAEEPADVVLVDCLLWGATDELAGTNVPVVSVVHSIADFFARNARGPLGMLARLRGTNPDLSPPSAYWFFHLARTRLAHHRWPPGLTHPVTLLVPTTAVFATFAHRGDFACRGRAR